MRAIGFAIGLALQFLVVASVQAEPIDLAIEPCLRSEATAIRRAVQVELGPLAAPGAAAVQVVVACDGDILMVTVVDTVRGALRFRIDPSGIPATARARLVALAISEAVEASHIELAPAPVIGASPFSSGPRPLVPMHEVAGAAEAARAIDDLDLPTLHGLAAARSLGSQATTFGVGIAALLPLSDHTALSGDVLAEGGLSPVSAGNVRLILVSLAPRLLARARYRSFVLEIGAGMRVGIARLSGQPSEPAMVEGRTIQAAWGGPIAVSAVRVPLGSRVRVGMGLEAGYTTLSVVGRIPMAPPVELRGAWLGLHLSAGVDLR